MLLKGNSLRSHCLIHRFFGFFVLLIVSLAGVPSVFAQLQTIKVHPDLREPKMLFFSPMGFQFPRHSELANRGLVVLHEFHRASNLEKRLAEEVEVLLAPTAKQSPARCLLVMMKGRVLIRKCWGMARLADKNRQATPATVDTSFRIASLTKHVTAAALLRLVQDKQLASLDEPFDKLFPSFPTYGKNITPRMLLNHRSGLRAYPKLIPSRTHTQITDENVFRYMLKLKSTYFRPGSKFVYSNTGYAVAAVLASVKSSMRFTDYAQKTFFAPNQMKDTVFYEQGIHVIKKRAYGHSFRRSRFVETDQNITSGVLGDGGLYTSIADLEKWFRAYFGGNILSSVTLKQVFRPSSYYSMGWVRSSVMDPNAKKKLLCWAHSGSTTGFRSAMRYVPSKQLIVALISNQGGLSAPHFVKTVTGLYVQLKPQ